MQAARVTGLQFGEKLALKTSGAEALKNGRDVIAALKALRHPKSGFSANAALRPRVLCVSEDTIAMR
jgi:hypothetical protein